MGKSSDIKRVREIYHNNRMVPFIGSGLSRVFNVPDWKELLIKLNEQLIDEQDIVALIDSHIKQGQYWDAVDEIIDYSNKDEGYIQIEVASIIKNMMIKEYKSIDNNYIDLNSINVPFFLTTNYDNCLCNFVDSKYQPVVLSSSNDNTQTWTTESTGRRIFHLHGEIANTSSIILSKSTYENLYSSERYVTLFNFLRGGYTFLFMGFSFADQYIADLFKTYNKYFNDYHYILLANPTPEVIKKYMREYKLIVIGYEVKDESSNEEHVKGIRNILNEIVKDEEKVNF